MNKTINNTSSIATPSRHLLMRVALPLTLIVTTGAVLLWTGWRSFMPLQVVDVIPVSTRAAGLETQEISVEKTAPKEMREGNPVQAPGWIEPSPFPFMVPALTSGIVRTVAVLEGEPVTAGQVLVELIDDEQRIALRLAEAQFAEVTAKQREMQDELKRKEPLVASGAASAGEVARLRIRIDAMKAAVEAADAERALRALTLERTKVRAPVTGVVLARSAVPGMVAGSMQDGKPLIEIYNPKELQVRADVPFTDAGRIMAGDRAEVMLDILPDRTFQGEVIRLTHQADIAKNTVQAKVRIIDPAQQLKPEMLARVKLYPRILSDSVAARVSGTTSWILEECIDTSTTPPTVLVVEGLVDGRGIVKRRQIELAAATNAGWRSVKSGLRAGDLALRNPNQAPAVETRVSITQSWKEKQDAPSANQGVEHHGNH